MPSTINASTSSGIVSTADTSGVLELQSNGTTKLTVASTGAYGQLVSGTAVASTSGTSIDFTSIPSWVKRITVIFTGVSTNGTSTPIIQLGDAGGIEITGYVSGLGYRTGETTSTIGFLTGLTGAAANSISGIIPICLYNTNAWATSGVTSRSDGWANNFGGFKTLSDTLDRIRITTVNGTDTFDAGSINIQYEG
jgi:hypothetical protein